MISKDAHTPLEVLRDRKAETADFRKAAREVCTGLMQDLKVLLQQHEADPKRTTFVIILRSAIALLDPALREFPHAPVGVLGMKRDERTLVPYSYYENLPLLREQDAVVILDPMLATATPGLKRLVAHIPRKNIILAAVDKKLDAHGMIVPGLGDFGDRYFGYDDGTLVI